uniref:Putative LOC100899380 [Metaseiulus occidentalis] n=1 Tax=Lepeophtheirus salmonis TaxID=72036 RepID=A0A0K2TB23_LEPSM
MKIKLHYLHGPLDTFIQTTLKMIENNKVISSTKRLKSWNTDIKVVGSRIK